jgi:TonB-linked SusC/RagA family outer membrane protein
VTDENSEDLPGVNVVIQGTSEGTITDFEGNYQIEVPSEESILIFSYVGYIQEAVSVSGRSVINVSLIPDLQELSEIIVVGYGTMKKSDVTGAITSIKKEDITAVRSANVVESLQGKAAGVDITRKNGRAGSGYDVRIRGTRSLTASNDPLYIVDGIQYGTSNIDINPNDIESIEILKDASSTAIYGSRGANGVIIITTKQGKEGKSNISVNAYYGVSSPNGSIPLGRKDYYLQFKNDLNWMRSWANNPNALPPTNGYLAELRPTEIAGLNAGYDYDWYEALLQNGRQQDYNISISGGSEKTTYNSSISYYQEDGLIAQDIFQRMSIRLNVDTKINKIVNAGTASIVSFSKNISRPNPLGDARKLSPLVEPYDQDGNIIPYPKFPDEVVNPFLTADPDYRFSEDRFINAFSTFYLNFNLMKNLSFKTSFNLDLDLIREGDFTGVWEGINGTSTGEAKQTIGTDYTWQNVLSYDKNFRDHGIIFTLGNEILYRRNEKYSSYGQNLTIPNSQWYNLGGASTDSYQITSYLEEEKLVSFFGRLHYGFKDRYLFQFTGRYDGASQLAPENQWNFFPSASFAWRINEEQFLQGVDLISNMKLRLGYGVTGNQAVDPYAHFGLITEDPLYYEFGIGNTPFNGYRTRSNTNNDLTWERTSAYNIGFDFGILDNRIQGTIEVYQTETDELLRERKLSPSSGITEIVANIGSTRNQGFELTLNTKNINTGGFTWDSDITYFRNTEEITALEDGVEQDLLNGWFVGYPVDVYYDREKIGIWQLGEEEQAALYGLKPGDIKVRDINNDSTYNDLDRVILGNPRPKYTIGFNNRLSYKNFDFSFYIYARMGQMIQDDVMSTYAPNGLENGMELDYWTPYNPTNETPRPDPNRTRSGYSELSSGTYTDGSFVKFRDITLGYNFPQPILDKMFISKMRIYVTARNPIILGEFYNKGRWDPELEGAIDIPMPKLFAVGLNVTF